MSHWVVSGRPECVCGGGWRGRERDGEKALVLARDQALSSWGRGVFMERARINATSSKAPLGQCTHVHPGRPRRRSMTSTGACRHGVR